MLQESHKALIYISLLSAFAFQVARQFLPFAITEQEFNRWQLVWFATNIIAFLTAHFWIYLFVMTVFLVFMMSRESLKPVIYLLLIAALPIENIPIPGIAGMQKLIDMSHARFLALVVLLPLFFQFLRSEYKTSGHNRVIPVLDILIISYVILLSVLQLRNFEATHAVRIFLSLFLDIFLPYFVFSRLITTVNDLVKCCYVFIMTAMALALIGALETAKYWHLYLELHYAWVGSYVPLPYLERSGMLRAYASIVPFPIALGIMLMVAMAFLLGLMKSFHSSRYPYAFYGYLMAFGILGVGLIATLSRAPWIGAALVFLIYFATGPRFVVKMIYLAGASSFALIPLMFTKFGNKIMGILPFFGEVEVENVTYRQELLHYALKLIERYPWFGTPDYLSTPEMRAMVNGAGLIDIVNSYIQIAIENGLVGLSLFVSFFVLVLLALYRSIRSVPDDQDELKQIGRGLFAALTSVMIIIFTVSSAGIIPYVYWILAGLSVAYIRLAYKAPVVHKPVRAVRLMKGVQTA